MSEGWAQIPTFLILKEFYTSKLKYSCSLLMSLYGNKSLLNQNDPKLKWSLVNYNWLITYYLQAHDSLTYQPHKHLEEYSVTILRLPNEETEAERSYIACPGHRGGTPGFQPRLSCSSVHPECSWSAVTTGSGAGSQGQSETFLRQSPNKGSCLGLSPLRMGCGSSLPGPLTLERLLLIVAQPSSHPLQNMNNIISRQGFYEDLI